MSQIDLLRKRSYADKSGYSQHNEELGEDPLTSVRTLRNVLRKKRIQAEQEDRMVEASMCRRACERLDEAEDDITELKKKHSSALIHSDTATADRHRQAMCDIRDTAFRAVHADLLLERNEVRPCLHVAYIVARSTAHIAVCTRACAQAVDLVNKLVSSYTLTLERFHDQSAVIVIDLTQGQFQIFC